LRSRRGNGIGSRSLHPQLRQSKRRNPNPSRQQPIKKPPPRAASQRVKHVSSIEKKAIAPA
jgi:hypothetical protein